MSAADGQPPPPMRKKYVLTVTSIVILAVLLVWGGWSLWTFFALEWCPGIDCARYLLSGGAMLLAMAAIAGLAAAASCWRFYTEISHRPAVMLGAGSAAVLLPLLFAAGDLRSTIAAHYFPYVVWFRFGYTGLLLVWSLLSIVGCAAVVSFAKRGASNGIG